MICPRCSQPNDDDANQCETCGEILATLCDGPKPIGLARPWPGSGATAGATATAHATSSASPRSGTTSAPSSTAYTVTRHSSARSPHITSDTDSLPEPATLPFKAVIQWTFIAIAGFGFLSGILAALAYTIRDYGDPLLLSSLAAGFGAAASAAAGLTTTAVFLVVRWTDSLFAHWTIKREKAKARKEEARLAREKAASEESTRVTLKSYAARTSADDSDASPPDTVATTRSSYMEPPPPDLRATWRPPPIPRRDSIAVTSISIVALVFAFMGVIYSFIPLLGVFALFTAIPATGLSIAGLVVGNIQRAKLALPLVALIFSLVGVSASMLQGLLVNAAVHQAAKSAERTSDQLATTLRQKLASP